jgi:hypothetical protein
MQKLIVAGLLAAAGLAAFAESSHAGVFLRVPFVTVQVDPAAGVFVGAPGVRVQVPPRLAAPAGPTGVIVSQPALAVPTETLPTPTAIAVVAKPMTVEQFAENFQPKPGKYEVVLIHPKSCQPVKVCFELPAGCPTKVRWTKHVLEFDYLRCSVRIRFYHDGDVKVLN